MLKYILIFCFCFNLFAQDSQNEGEEELVPEKRIETSELQENISNQIQALQNMDENQKKTMLENLMKNQNDVINDFIKNNPFASMSREDVKKLLLERSKNVKFGQMFEENPATLEFAVDILQDKHALPKFFGIIAKKDELKKYGFITIALIVISFILNFKNKSGSLIKRIGKKLLITLGITFLSIMSFYFIFKEDITPAFNIFKKHFL
jgi:hypothetical protein